jgi:mannose-6-phosphate isomerase-like protein (cupin superfamily)
VRAHTCQHGSDVIKLIRAAGKMPTSLDKEDVMFKKNRGEVRQREYDGLRSHIFLQQGDIPQTNLSITWVDVAPGASQMLHRHGPEQVYVIIDGTGRMCVGEEE